MTCKIEQENESLRQRNKELEEAIVALQEKVQEMLADLKK